MVSPHPTANNGFSIEVGCPGCGADLTLEQDFRLLQCSHCGSVLRILMPDLPPAFFTRPKKSEQEVKFFLDRHCRENHLPMPRSSSTIQLTYYPYWKIDATTLKVRTSTYEVPQNQDDDSYDDHVTEERELTTINLAAFSSSVPATQPSAGIPFSLGVRTGYLPLTPFVPTKIGESASCLQISAGFDAAVDLAIKAVAGVSRFDSADHRSNSTLLFHPTGTIIYFPYYLVDTYETQGIRRYAIDAVTGRVAGSDLLGETPTSHSVEESVRFGALNVEFHRCTNCGVDLPMGNSLVYACHNCSRVEFLESHTALSKDLLLTTGKSERSSTLFPFWIIKATTDQSSSEHQFVVPAFDMRNAETVYRLSSRITTAIRKIQYAPIAELIRQDIPVTRSIDNALALLEVLWYRRAAEMDILKNKTFQPCTATSVQLLFVPFSSQQYFFVDDILKAVTFEKAGALAPSR